MTAANHITNCLRELESERDPRKRQQLAQQIATAFLVQASPAAFVSFAQQTGSMAAFDAIEHYAKSL